MKRYDDNNIECQKHTLLATIEFYEKRLKEAKKKLKKIKKYDIITNNHFRRY